MKNFIDSLWLNKNIHKEDLVILDARADLKDPENGLREYEKSHIVASYFVSLEGTMTGQVEKHGGRHPLPNLNSFKEGMEALGLSNSSTIVIYDDGNYAMAGRLWWMLKYIGLEKVYILKDGFESWKSKGYPVTSEVSKVEKRGSLEINLQKDLLVGIDGVKEAINSQDKIIVDARASNRYRGEVEPFDRIPGHIPSSINFPWTDLVESFSPMDKGKLEKHFKSLEEYDEVIVHCGSGITGTVPFLFMEEIGLKPKLYLGGYSDWVSYEDNKVISEF